MKELARTNDAVRLSWLQAVLEEAGIAALVLDNHTSIIEGSIGAIPRRLMVADEDHFRATALLAAAERDLAEPPS
jgi:putative signal transducing protein